MVSTVSKGSISNNRLLIFFNVTEVNYFCLNHAHIKLLLIFQCNGLFEHNKHNIERKHIINKCRYLI
jgi:hypothetical protein